MRDLTIGMAVYEDYDGVYFTIQSLRYYHQDADVSRIKYLVIDNCLNGTHSKHIESFLKSYVPNSKYINTDKIKGTAVRDLIFEEADTEYVMCLDSHVLLEPGSVKKLLEYYDKNQDTKDLLQGPLVHDDIYLMSTHFEPRWNEGMFGVWGFDERARNKDGEPFDIPAQGLGLFTCKKDAWLGFNRNFKGFGGEEFYTHEKFRQAGHRALCLPFLRWIHRFGRPNGTKYNNVWEDRIRNYVIGWLEIGRSVEDIQEHFSKIIGEEKTNEVIEKTMKEMGHELCV